VIVVLLAVLALIAAQTSASDVKQALEAGDYHSAWTHIGALPRGVERWRATAELLNKAGDHAGALQAAREGLALEPAHLELLYHAAHAAVWLQEPAAAVEFSARLQRRVASDESLLGAELHASWKQLASDFSQRSLTLRRHADERERASKRLRAVSVTGLIVALVFVGAMAWRGYGRFSSPVS
jgi:hypothetical protein